MRYQFMRFPGGKSKAVTLSYDDGVREDIRFSEIINKYGMKCTFNLNGDTLQRKTGLTKEEVEQYLLGNGHEIAVHGENHRAEGALRPIEGIREILDCRMGLEEKYGRIIRGMAYPDSGITYFTNGASYESVKNYLKELDIVYSRTLGGDNDSFAMPQDWHAWMPTAHHKNPKIFEYIEKFNDLDMEDEKVYRAKRQPRLFYLWGHSYEFEKDQNWDLLEKICQELGEKENVWYATNMEIYNYTIAYQSLIYSADGTMVYNPTHQKIWFDVDRKLYTIEPDETIHIS